MSRPVSVQLSPISVIIGGLTSAESAIMGAAFVILALQLFTSFRQTAPVALGLVLIYRSTRILHFAHGDITATGTFMAFFMLGAHLPFWAAAAGGLILGVAESLAGGCVSIAFKNTLAFVIIIIVLLVRPEGVLGEEFKERV